LALVSRSLNRPFCVGLTGGIAAGKTEVADRFAERGVVVVDTDRIARDLTRADGQAIAPLVRAFGRSVLASDGGLDRRSMRARAFVDPQIRRQLEAILHPLIRIEAQRRVEGARSPYVVVVVPLLLETGAYRDLVDRVLVVDCDEQTQLARAMARDGMDDGQARAILASQASRAERLAAADDVIQNLGGLDGLAGQLDALHARYLDEAKNRGQALP
jgi:dephospho-CoA kinase